jgi:hypothetical protein
MAGVDPAPTRFTPNIGGDAASVRPAGDTLEFPKSGSVLVVGKDASAPPSCTGDTEPLSRSHVAVLSAVTAATPIPIPNSNEKNPSRTSRRKREVGATAEFRMKVGF